MKRSGFRKLTFEEARARCYGLSRKPRKPLGYSRSLKRSGPLKARRDTKLAAWSKAVRERDGNQCQWPGGCETGDTRIDAHHIAKRSQRPDKKYLVDNGVCLCRTHHDATDTNRATAIRLGMLSTETYEAANAAREAAA